MTTDLTATPLQRYAGLEELVQRASRAGRVRRAAIVAAEDGETAQAAVDASRQGIAQPVFVGNRREIEARLDQLEVAAGAFEIVDAPTSEEAARRGVELAASGAVDFLVKGHLETATLMRAVLSRDAGLRTGRLLSSVGFLQIPTYHKLLGITDTAINIQPGLAEKIDILRNALDVLAALDITMPKVAVLGVVEKVNPSLPDTVDAAALKQLYLEGEFTGCVVDGPLSYDLAVSTDSARMKGFEGSVAGDADLLVFPDLSTGNTTSKALVFSGGARVAAVICGARVPIVLTSRSSSAQEKRFSMALASLVATTKTAAKGEVSR